jgi:hypothetical protein
MKITLDHNCIIDLENRTATGKKIEEIVSHPSNKCFVVNIGASEMRQRGVLPDHYEKFEELLKSAGVEYLPRLDPMGVFDVTFFDKCVFADDEMKKLSTEIESVLFPDQSNVDVATLGLDSPEGKKWLNRLCDVHTMWCHIKYGNEVFLTTDANFKKQTKLPKLVALGAGRICHPNEL